MDSKALFAVLVLALTASCGSSRPDSSLYAFADGQRAFPGFDASNVHAGVFYARASHVVDSKSRFKIDLLEDHRIITVELAVELMGGSEGDDASIELRSDLMDARLYLENGTSLPCVRTSEVRAAVPEKSRQLVQDSEIESRPIRGRADPIDGVLFFRVPAGTTVQGDRIYVADAGGSMHSLDLRRSLLSFRYVSHEGGRQVTRTVYVGLQK